MELQVVFLVSLLTVSRIGTAQSCAKFVNLDACEWAAITNGKKYSFNLLNPIKAYPHGILSEDGFYKVSTIGEDTHYWFQACGGTKHCGETCSALMSTSYPGYSVCTALGNPGSIQYSLINSNKPEQGVRVNMTSCHKMPKLNCSFSVLVYCSQTGVEAPSTVTIKTAGGCDYETALSHPAGCPVVTNVSEGGWGWFSSLFFMFVVAFVVYMAVGIAYRVTVLGVSGFEAIPNLDIWRNLPSKVQLFTKYIILQFTGIYYRLTEDSYSRLNT
ncbi:hypothetical protein M758_UG050100 [Ceratodon purpureus]|nr:hypothetical protein M758_UG050100 [Ceratodon purpureus]